MRRHALALTGLTFAAASFMAPAVADEVADDVAASGDGTSWETEAVDRRGDQRLQAFDLETEESSRPTAAEKRVLRGTDLRSFRLEVKRAAETPFMRATFEVTDVQRRTRRLRQTFAVLLEGPGGSDVGAAWVSTTAPGASPVVKVDGEGGGDAGRRCRGASARLRYQYRIVVLQVPLSCLRDPQQSQDTESRVRALPITMSGLRIRSGGATKRIVDAVDFGPRLKRVPLTPAGPPAERAPQE